MVGLKKLSRVMENPKVYRLWQAPFARSKFEPILRHNRLDQVRRVLDVGCGPGTNTAWFGHADYLGLDINPRYVEMAKMKFGREFITADARTYVAPETERFDFILLNSLLHHIDTDNVYAMLRQLSRQLTPDGHVHILDLILPEQSSIARWLALGDRGDFPRPLVEWQAIFRTVFEEVVLEPYPLTGCGLTLWNMVYFKGKAKA